MTSPASLVTIELPLRQRSPNLPPDRPVVLAGSGRCGSTLLQSVLNTNPDFLIWGEHNGFLRQIAAAYYDAPHPWFPSKSDLDAEHRIKKLRDGRRWPAWDNLCGEADFQERFRAFVRSFFADPTGRAARWGFKEIRYARDRQDRTLPFLFECFPEMRLIVLVRQPQATIFSALSRWIFRHQRDGNIGLDDLDRRIIETADSWNVQYMLLDALCQAHPSKCLRLRYEDLGQSKTYRELSKFLDTSSFAYQSHTGKVKDASNKSDPTARLIRQRIEFLQPQIAAATCGARAALRLLKPCYTQFSASL